MKDLLCIDEVDEAHVVKEVVARYRRGDIYTFLGPVLIAVNPYKLLRRKDNSSIYDPKWISDYSGVELHQCEPHPFAIAESAYTNMMRFGYDQSLLITGESGSGKTETSKHVMQYLTTISTRNRARSAAIANRRMSIVQRQELDHKIAHVTDVLWGSNPVLEAFGNAQTIRNNNSSRFGKYIVLQLNRIGQVIGGYVDNYLLERSRIIHQTSGERNFHAFYQLLAGATNEERERWNLLAPEEYDYLNNRAAVIEGIDDKENFKNVRANMEAVGISVDEQNEIFQQLAAVLWLGNIHFREEQDEAHNKCAVVEDDTREALENAARLMGIELKHLEQMMSYRYLNIYGEDQKIIFDKRQAKKVCDSIARSMYDNVFNWIVARINHNVACDAQRVSSSIGILDIYGFEIFEVNAFEQLCINYVNEKLQQLFIAQTLQAEQDEYKREAIAWKRVEYFNNQVVCDLIEDPKIHGIFPLLDEQCAIARLSDLELIERYNSSLSKHPHFIASRIQGPHFSIEHYAGKVEYDVTLFFDANVDTFFNDMYKSMAESSVPFVRDVFRDKRTPEEKKKRPPSTSLQFRTQVQDLLKKLEGCNPHYIRCIKPNEEKAALQANETIIAEQVRYLGLVENLKVRRQGYFYRESYGTFVERYRCLSPETWPVVKANSTRVATCAILATPGVVIQESGMKEAVPFGEDADSLGCYSLGRTKVFLRHPQALSALEILRENKIPEIVGIIESAWGRYKGRQSLVKFVDAERELTAAYVALEQNILARRMRHPGANDKQVVDQLKATWHEVSGKLLPADNYLERRLVDAERTNTIVFAQSFVRAQNQRRAYLTLRRAQIVFSRRYRGVLTRKQLSHELWKSCKTALLGVRTEFERFLGKKKRRRDTLDRPYKGDYVGLNQYPAYSSLLNARGPQQFVFAAQVEKVNERFAHQARVLLVGDKHVFNLKADKLYQPKERRVVPLAAISGIAMSTLPDNYVVLQVKGDFDMLLVVSQKTELVTLLRKTIQTKFNRELPVTFSDEITFLALKNRPQVLKFSYNRHQKQTTWQKVDKRTMSITVGMS